jgi:hypothetical protein
MISGLHSCKPGNEPVVGQVKTFTVEQRTAASGKAWTKIKGTPADQGGVPFKITSVKPTGHTDSYGNVSFNLEIEPTAEGATQPQPKLAAGGQIQTYGNDDRSNRIERQHSQEMALRYLAITKKECNAENLRPLIDWFQRDISRTPLSAVEQQAKTMFNATEADDDNEEPF